jgi:hypothetical protein
MALTKEQEDLWFAELEKMGRERVRASLDQGTISPPLVSLAWDWLSKKEAEEKRRQDVSISEQVAEMKRASAAAERQAAAAERANTRATIALVIAIISIIVSAIGIWMPYWSVHK